MTSFVGNPWIALFLDLHDRFGNIPLFPLSDESMELVADEQATEITTRKIYTDTTRSASLSVVSVPKSKVSAGDVLSELGIKLHNITCILNGVVPLHHIR